MTLLVQDAPSGLICRLRWKDRQRECYVEKTASVIGWDENNQPWVMHPVVGSLLPATDWILRTWPEELGNDERWVHFIRESDDGVQVAIVS